MRACPDYPWPEMTYQHESFHKDGPDGLVLYQLINCGFGHDSVCAVVGAAAILRNMQRDPGVGGDGSYG